MDAQQREDLVAVEMAECRHWSGTHNESCKAGVNYRQLAGGPNLGWALRLPCYLNSIGKARSVEPSACESRSCWSREEAEANVDRADLFMGRVLDAARAAHDDAKSKGLKRGSGGSGECPCPACGGVIRYSVASVNGHMHAVCSTPDCVRWME